ncbi:Rad4-domain-containing protein [Coniochaeta ligniaria NRRL 30616]|uniref:Rad4-domain-containing protein n=1 Tax=Coniochaeta ligniaria NRRL 30616 TaxID=1408157 RepID=A0A1J7IZ79_9PEZI|nr:Rad4-domain-containing protein [Coniochaeta ligniaria NRRL 30616]
MPPYVPRKRTRGSPPSDIPVTPKSKAATTKGKAVAPPRKPTLFDDLDATSTPRSSEKPGSASRTIEDSDDDDSSLTSLSDGDFEDVPLPKRRKVEPVPSDDEDEDLEFEDVPLPKRRKDEPVPSDDEDEDIEFEDVRNYHFDVDEAPLPSGDLELTLIRDERISLENKFDKKGPSKRERKVRISTHCVHVMFLMWHNSVRNSWLCDPEVQGMLLSHLPPGLWDEVERWRRNSGLEVAVEPPKKTVTAKSKGKGKGKAVATKSSRDWDQAAERLERGVIDLSHGDPLFRLMKALSSWWKKRFRVTAPGLRKWGYMSLERLDRVTKAYKEANGDTARFGERIEALKDFRRCAQQCTGSRDVGAQLFTALLRGLGLEARMVANLQPLGFGWNKLEDADPEKEASNGNASPPKPSASVTPAAEVPPPQPKKSLSKPARRKSAQKPPALQEERSFELHAENSDDESVVEIPIATPKKAAVYDKDLEFPHYWTEVLSPVTRKYLPVDAIVKSVVATNRELVESLEPRGAKAERARQVMAYVVGFSQDGTAKDVTVRYLKRQVLPGRTKGMRIPIEKMPVYNRNGKVKRYDQYDWFRAVMRGYSRGSKQHPITEVDEEEQSTDLKPKQPEKKEVKEGEETLQYYKQSKEFVLERHLKREEALLPTAEPVKVFKNKGKSAEEPVYSRKDVVQVKSAETWHKQGRAPLPGEQPLKRVPYRAATTNRRREIAEAEAATGEKVLQGLYSFDQTDWIIPEPIKDGIIPKNDYGNIDLFAEHMCPAGAVHVPYRGAMRVCKRLEIDYAEAVVDFEFGHRMAVPVIQGVVIAEEYHDQVMQEIAKDEAERSRKEDEKRTKAALGMWRKMLMKMRIAERIQRDYGHIQEDDQVFGRGKGGGTHADEELAGGFLPEGYEMEDEDKEAHQVSGFFPVAEDGDDGDDDDMLEVDHGGGFESGFGAAAEQDVRQTLRIAKPRAAKGKPVSSRRRRRRVQPSSDEEEDDDDDLVREESDEEYDG